MTISRTWGSIGAIAASTLVPISAAAQVAGAIRGGLANAAKPAGYLGGATNPIDIIGGILNALLGFMGILLVLYFLYGGFLYMTAGGESKKVDLARDTIKNAVIGTIIVTTAFALTVFVLDQLTTAFGGGYTAPVSTITNVTSPGF